MVQVGGCHLCPILDAHDDCRHIAGRYSYNSMALGTEKRLLLRGTRPSPHFIKRPSRHLVARKVSRLPSCIWSMMISQPPRTLLDYQLIYDKKIEKVLTDRAWVNIHLSAPAANAAAAVTAAADDGGTWHIIVACFVLRCLEYMQSMLEVWSTWSMHRQSMRKVQWSRFVRLLELSRAPVLSGLMVNLACEAVCIGAMSSPTVRCLLS